MGINDVKKTISYSLDLMLIIVVLTWIDNACDYWSWFTDTHSVFDKTLFPVIISILAAMVVMIIYQHSISITRGSILSAFLFKSSPDTRKRFDNLLEYFQESIVLLDLDGEIKYCNERARKLFALSKSASHILLDESFPIKTNEINTIKNNLRSGQIWERKSIVKIDGREREFMHRIYPLSIQNDPAQVVVISTDITDLAEAQNNADIANLSKDQFLANMTHELRTPMIGILGSSDLLNNTNLSTEQHLHLDTIRECGEQLLNTINDILDLSRIDLGIDSLRTKPVNLQVLLEKTVDMFAGNLSVKDLQLNMYIDPAIPPLLMIDELKLRQVITNILINAIKFTPSGYINIKAVLENQRGNNLTILFSIEDTGIGIPAEKLDAVFNSFTQADNSSCREFGGTGLGLYICKKLISLMAGEIWVNSIEGQGTRVEFRVPLNTAFVEKEEVIKSDLDLADGDELLANSFLPIRILVVEDNQLNLKLIIQMLMSYGFEVEYVNNGLECLRILEQKSFDLILMDMQMPVMDGYEATRTIRAHKDWGNIPIIAITANAMSGDREKCLDCGCSSYLAKPFKSAELVQEIKTQLKTEFFKRPDNDPFSNQLIAELIPEFIELLAEMLDDLRKAINLRNIKEIQNISHAIKGTAGMYGFQQISEIAAHIEQASRDNQYHKITQLFMQITASYQQINTRLCSDVVV